MRTPDRPIALIGMSNIGKSYWGKELQKDGYGWFECDEKINGRLNAELQTKGFSGLAETARWMGQPFDTQYPTTSRKYLELEESVTREGLAKMAQSPNPEHFVLDTTGSVIYLPKEILKELRERTRIVYLSTPEFMKEEMYQRYLVEPKPVIWGDVFRREEEETDMEALGRCYPLLLAERTRRYEDLADVTLDYHQLRRLGFTVEDFLRAIF